jgi:hypothetical protein
MRELLKTEGRYTLFYDWLVDEKHKVLVCMHHKVGLSTWFNILCNSTLPPDVQPRRQAKCINNNTLVYRLDDERYTDEDIVHRLRTYYKVMTVRHPLDRLVSAYRFCYRDENSHYTEHLGTRILGKYREGVTSEQLKFGRGVWFQEMIQYINDGYYDVHWRGPYEAKCHPCSIHFNAILKIETFEEDVTPIINDKFKSSRSDHKALNSVRTTEFGSNRFNRILKEFQNITDDQLLNITRKYAMDFQQFGYNFTRTLNGTVITSCSLQTKDGRECC